MVGSQSSTERYREITLGDTKSQVASSRAPFILFVVNDANFFLSHRQNIASEALRRGFEVGVATPPSEHLERVKEFGFQPFPIPLSKWGSEPFAELRAVRALIGLYRTLRPDLVHHVTIKPVIYGSIAARVTKIRSVVNAIPGLGHVFSSQGFGAQIRRGIVKTLYKITLKNRRQRVIFQNEDDLNYFLSEGLVDSKQTVLLPGAGVNMSTFTPAPEPAGTVKVLFSGRLLWKKGLGEYMEAAKILKERQVDVQFQAAGEFVPGNPGGIKQDILDFWKDSGIVNYLGYRRDMPQLIQDHHIVCLPSFYGEGVPKALIEAASSGRPIVATDSSGCRSIVKNGENGFLVPPQDGAALADAIESLVKNPILRERMGVAGRNLVLDGGFNEENIVEQTCAVYEGLLG